jgi:nucleoside-triphosphatase
VAVASQSPAHVLLITGRPGVGKTTIVRKVAAALSGRRLGGFYTEEIRAAGMRQGFRLVTFDGREWTMAHVEIRGPHRVGRYGVDVAAVQAAAASALAPGLADLYLVDEVGRMECLSPVFVVALRQLLDLPATVVATVALRGQGLIAEIKHRPDVELWTVTSANRDEAPARVAAWLERA